jgi:predicted O-methyltransferase YrrM
MSTRSFGMTEAFQAYMLGHMVHESEPLRALRQEADRLAERAMRMAPEQGQLMAFLVSLTGARRVLEIGTFVGYGTLWMASALPKQGTIVTCDIEPKFPALAAPFWRQAGVADRIDLRVAPALDTLDAMLSGGSAASFDLAFIDADKPNYPHYYERTLKLVRPGGLILVDNVFWDGLVADPANRDAETEAIREVQRRIHADPRREAVTIPVGDGLTIVRQPG